MAKKAARKKAIRGLDVRDQFAIQALHGVLATCATADGVMHFESITGRVPGSGHKWMAKLAYQMADAMLQVREGR